MKKVGINGIAGRIGKFAAYEYIQLGGVIGAVNDIASTDDIIDSLSRKDGVHGKLDWAVEKIDEENIRINNNIVIVSHDQDPINIFWDNATVVNECTGFYNTEQGAKRHFQKNVSLETVLISAPGDMKTLVMGVNHKEYTREGRIISNASCTTKALAMPMKVLLDKDIQIYGVLMDTTHAATNTQKPLDFMGKYGALDSIQSAKTGAAIATSKVIQYLEGKVDGFAMRVPTRNGSFANIYLVAEGENLSVDSINSMFELAVNDEQYAGRIDVFDGKEIASPDIIGNTASSVIALSKTKSLTLPIKGEYNPANNVCLIGIVAGYDNERGSAKDLALLTEYVLQQQE